MDGPHDVVRRQLLNIFDRTLAAPESGRGSKNSKDVLARFLKEVDAHHNREVHCLQDLKQRDDKKLHGDLFELFAQLYLKVVLKIPHVWLLREVPETDLDKLRLRRRDMGIDIVGLDDDGNYYACQVKYKSHNNSRRKIAVTWKEVSTFFSLAERTGPYATLIVLTTANYVRHVAPKTAKDLSICVGTLGHIAWELWLEMRELLRNQVCRSHRTLLCAAPPIPAPIEGTSQTTLHAKSEALVTSSRESPVDLPNRESVSNHRTRVYFDTFDEETKTWKSSAANIQPLTTRRTKAPIETIAVQATREARLRHFRSHG